MTEYTTLEAAKEYFKRGWSVLPLKPDDKRPALATWKELQKKRWGIAEINDWWGQNPTHGVGIVTGKISGISVIDIDDPDVARAALKTAGIKTPPTFTVKTRKGFHLYYQYNKDFGQGAGRLSAVDIRNDGGFVVAPPTVINTHTYIVHKKNTPQPFGPVPVELTKNAPKQSSPDTPLDTQPQWIADALINGASEGQRNDMATKLAGYFHSRRMGADVIEATLRTFADNCKPPMDYHELTQVIQSVMRYSPEPFTYQGESIPAPTAQFLADNRVRFHWEEQGLTIVLERVRMHGDGIPCLLTVGTKSSGVLYGPIRFDLMSGTQRTTARRAMPDMFAWEGYFNYLAQIVRDHYTQIEPTVDLATIVPKGQAEWLIYPLVRGTKPYIVFGDGGAGKSTFCLALALSLAVGKSLIPGIEVQSEGNSLYLDYEQEDEDVAATLFALAAGVSESPRGVIYQRMNGPVSDHVEQLKRTVKEHSIRLLIVDHIVAASGGDAKDEDSARIFFAALREIGVATLAIGHVAKGNDKTVYGSTFWTNFARGMFKIEGFQEPNSPVNHVELFNTKNNRGSLMRPLAFDVVYAGDEPDMSIVFKTADIQSDSQTAKTLGWVERISATIRRGALTASDIATELNESRETVSRELQRPGRKDTHWAMQTGTQKWGLLQQAPDHQIPRDIPRDIPTPPPYGGLGVVGNEKEEDRDGMKFNSFTNQWDRA